MVRVGNTGAWDRQATRCGGLDRNIYPKNIWNQLYYEFRYAAHYFSWHLTQGFSRVFHTLRMYFECRLNSPGIYSEMLYMTAVPISATELAFADIWVLSEALHYSNVATPFVSSRIKWWTTKLSFLRSAIKINQFIDILISFDYLMLFLLRPPIIWLKQVWALSSIQVHILHFDLSIYRYTICELVCVGRFRGSDWVVWTLLPHPTGASPPGPAKWGGNWGGASYLGSRLC